MGTSFRFLAIGNDTQQIPDWFAALPEPPERVMGKNCEFLYFRTFGGLAHLPNSTTPDLKHSPIASLILPKLRRSILWTAGEVHFLSTPLRQYPGLESVSRKFKKWLFQNAMVFEGPGTVGEWDYFLEGALKNRDTPVYALPEAFKAISSGQYFIDHLDNDFVLDKLCRSLRLRGVSI